MTASNPSQQDLPADRTDDDVLLFRDGDELLLQGDPANISAILEQLLTPGQAKARRDGLLRRGTVDAAAVAASGGALLSTSAELMRFTPESLEKIKEFGLPQDKNGAIRASVRRANGQFAGDLKMEAISFRPEQALALQSAAVSLALRTAIAQVEAAVAEVDAKVTEVLARERSRQIGEIAGLQTKLKRLSDETVTRGHLLEADWESVASAGPALEQALTSLRALATDKISALAQARSLSDRADVLESLSGQTGLPNLLQLILLAEDALHRWEHLRVQRVRVTDPEHIESVLESARATLTVQQQADRTLVQTAQAALDAAKVIDPLGWPRFLSIKAIREEAEKVADAVEAFGSATRVEIDPVDRTVLRPSFREARHEAGVRAGNARRAAGHLALEAGRGAKGAGLNVAGKARERVSERRRRD